MFAIVSLEHREPIVCSIFDRSDGLLHFLNALPILQSKNKQIDDALKEAFIFLDFFIQNFYTTPCFIQYVHEIKTVCQVALTVKSNYFIKKAAFKVFVKLIELFKDHDLKLVDTVKKFAELIGFNLNTVQERKFMYCVLGKTIKHNESVHSLQNELNIIFQRLNSDASWEYNSNKVFDFHMYFNALADILDGVKSPNAIQKTYFCNLYKWIKDISKAYLSEDQPRQQKIKTAVVKSAIDLLCRHMNLFQDKLYPDCMHWHEILQPLSLDRTECGISGQHALKRFYRVIGQILTNQNNDESQIFLEFLEYFHKEFEKSNLDLTTLRLNLYGFSQMAAPCKVHMAELDVRNMYSIITSYALPLCSSEHSDSMHIESVCCYQEALSEILCHMADVTIEKINVLVKLSNYTIKRFPDLAISSNALAVSTLTKTIGNLATVNKGLLQRYLDSIVYDGIAWSCSHTLALDAELQRELNDLRQSPVCYKNYLPLWTELLNAERYRARGIGGHEQLTRRVADTMTSVCITLINRLNIHVKRKNENTVLSDVALTQSAVNQADFRVFANLVDLYVDVIDASDAQLFANTVHRFLYEVVRLSYRYPLISGFYKLIRAGMKIFAHTSEEEGEGEGEENSVESQRMEELLSNYLWHTLDLIPAFSNELLIACLYLILDAPFAYVKDALPRTLPAFKIAFTVGLSNLELAYTALAALEMWTTTARKRKRDERTNELLREIAAYLEPYLRSTESAAEVSQDLTTARRRVKRIDVIDTECTLRNFQRRVMLFLGSLDHDLLTSFVHERASRSTGASWDRKDLLRYVLPLPNTRLDIHFDRTLPRIIALACDSSDRRTKIAACEVLHWMVTFTLGLSASRVSDPENPFIGRYVILCRAVLTLGCDSDEVVCGLFHPLALQLMHWLSSRHMSMSPVIDVLFDGLADDSNPALREFSGICLAEFTRWSMRQESNERHVHTIVGRINNLALHPSTRKRVAAAVAFNHLYAILREEDSTVSTYWLEIFYCFVRSLDGCDDPSIANALAHVEKVMKFRAKLLNTADSRGRRKKPHEFDNATLVHALYWLLSQCGTHDERCRARRMELYVNVSQYDGSSAQETTRNFVNTYGINRLNDIVLKGLETGVEDISAISNVTPLLKALDCYIWLMDKELLPVEMLFPANDVDEQPIFSHIRSFTSQFWRIIAELPAGTAATAMKSRELEQLRALQCKVLMTTLNFIQVLLNVGVNVPESLWNESLSALTIRCIMHPRIIGFDVKNIEIMDRLPYILETLLNSMKSRYGYAPPNTFKKCLLSSVQEHIAKLLNLHDIAQNDACDDLIQHVNGLILLKRCDMLDRTVLKTSAFTNGDRTVAQIFEFLVSECIGELACRDLSAGMIEYLRALMAFQFSLLSLTIETPVIIPDDVRSMIDTLVRFMSKGTPVTSVDVTTITHGEHFINTFRSVIFGYMLTHVGAITDVFDGMSRDSPSFLLKWIEDLLLFLKRHRRQLQARVDATADAILQQFTCLNNAVFNVDSRKERLMNIYSIAVHLKSRPTEVTQNREFYQWIRDQLANSNDLEYKTRILKNFFVCLTDVADRDLQISLRTLRADARSLCPNLSETSVNAMKVIDSFETLLVLLSTTRSMAMLKCVINFAAGAGKRLFNEKLEEHLRGYYHGASLEHVLESLQQTYRAFMEVNTTETERLDFLHGFLLPAFKFCDATATERFFEKNIQDLYETTRNLQIVDDDDAIKQKIVSLIGYYRLVAVMFARVDKNKIHANDETKASGKLLIDRKLYQSLYNSSENIRSLKITRPDCQELAHLLQCSAYNCLLAIISLKEKENFYRLAVSNKNGPFNWQIIVNCDTQYRLGQTFKEYPKSREITVNIRSAEGDGERTTHGYAYVHSYDLSACTLSEDINAYDLNKCVVLPAGSRYSASTTNSADSDPLHGATSIALTSNDFDQHECMPYICVLLRHIRKKFKLSDDKEPVWLMLFLNTIQRNDLHANIQLFMLKIISNTADEVFKPYARFALTKIIKTIANYLERNDLNYIITDVLEILMDWHDVAVPSSEDDKAAAQRLFEKFIDRAFRRTDDNRVYNYNLNLMGTMMAKWRGCLRVPSNFLSQKMQSASPVAVYLILALLDNDITEGIVAEDVVDFLLKLLKNWDTSKTDEATCLQCCKCLGLYLRSLDNGTRGDETERDSKKREIKERIFDVLKSKHQILKQIKRIVTLCRTYPEVAVDYIKIALDAFTVVKSYCLEIFLLAMPRLSAEDVVNNLRHMQLQETLKNRVSSSDESEKIMLQIVRDMVPIRDISSENLLLYVNLVIPYVKDNITEHRELVYDILTRVYKRYSSDITDGDETVQNLHAISLRNLLAGLLDPSHDLQDRILKFWTEEKSLSTKPADRLVNLLEMHSRKCITEQGDAFAPFVALLMLQLATKEIDYTRKIFNTPLQDCVFEEYKIAVSWRRRNLSCVTPMFVDSLASQMSYSIFSQSVDNDLRGTYADPRLSHGVPPRLRATQDLQFEPTIFDDDDDDATTSLDISSHDTGFDRTTIASSSRQSPQTEHRRFTRILANASDVIRKKQIRKNMQRVEKIKQENIRQRSSVKLYRNYRSGDFPDIETSHESLIVPLQQLIKLDRLICKDVTVSLFLSLINTIEKKPDKKDCDFRKIVNNLKRILHESCEKDSSFNVIILETLLKLSRDAATVTDCDPRDVMKASKANHSNALGALFLERSLLSEERQDDSSPTSSKRMRRHDDAIRNEETSKWVQLVSLYKSLNDVDVVLSIFRGQQSFDQNLQEAALAEVDGDWSRAKDAFTNAYELIEDSSIREHCLQGLLEAANNMCDWSAIDRLVKDRARNGELSSIWDDAWRDWMIPYVCDTYVHMREAEERSWAPSSDLNAIRSWIYDPDKLQHLMPVMGESLVIFLLEQDVRRATDMLNELLDMTAKQWIGLTPLSTELGIRKLFKLQIMNDLDASLKVLRSTNRTEYSDRTVKLLNFWSMKTPTIRDSLVQWNKLAAYRAYFSTLFQRNCRRVEIRQRLRQINYQLRLDIVNAALNQKHRYIAAKQSSYVNEIVCEEDVHLKWLEARIKSLCADVETDVSKRMHNYTVSWKSSHELLNKSDELDTAIKEHIGTLASRMVSLSGENDAFARALARNTTIMRDVGVANPASTDPDGDIREHLLRYSLNNLRSCCENTTAARVGEHYCALARHCYGRLTSTTDAESDEIFKEFLLSTLKSMRHDYLEATHYFPCLLRPERLRDDETRETFVRECAKLRPWLFLRWRDLLFSHLGTPSVATAIVPIVERLAETYPDAIAYNYHLTVDRNPSILRDENVMRIRSLLRDKAEEYERFLRAIEYVVQPKLYLKHYLDVALRDLSRGKATAIESLLRKISLNSSTGATEGKNPRPGAIFHREIATYENEIRALNPDDLNAAREKIQRLKESLNKLIFLQRPGMNRNVRGSASRLKDYSPFLHEYVGDGKGIEIPGQYTGDGEPMPRYHVRIARFEPQVQVMRSLRKPIRIGMVGDNGREYKFLVKFGEDLTIDRGLQQLYSTMNRTLRNDPGCRQRRLAIDTYEVIPLSSSFGLIQWIEDTRSLDELVQFTLTPNEKQCCCIIRNEYEKWIEKAAPTKRIKSDCYKEAVSRYSQSTVTETMKSLIGQTKQTALHDAFDTISSSPECFITLRRNFVVSYATMCTAHWLAGIGDRHLQNTLVRVATGRCLGIDFGHAFGSSIRASIPELVPFRLTPQILELLRPFTERDLLATIMTHTMRALRDDRGPILACMDIFVPVQRSLRINGDEMDDREDVEADSTWSSNKNIKVVEKKLNGIHPSLITMEQLKEAHNDFMKYDAIVTGNDELKQARASVKNDRLTPAQQVDCLLDQAKDLNILGRMYENWQPWL